MHGLISKISICYWQDQPDYYVPFKPEGSSGYRKVSPRLFSLLVLQLIRRLPAGQLRQSYLQLAADRRSTSFEKAQKRCSHICSLGVGQNRKAFYNQSELLPTR